MISQSLLAVLSIPLLASAHFHLTYPTPRSDVDDTEATFPCGGFAVSQNRTIVNSASFPVALEMGHDRTTIQMLLALGNNPGDNFDVVLQKTFAQEGEGDFCLPHLMIPSNLNIKDGSNGTLQIVTDGEGGGGLYICADLTFSTAAAEPPASSCTNGTGVTASPLPANEADLNANQTEADGSPQNGGSSASSGSATATASGSSGSASNQAVLMTAGWGVLGGAALGALALM